MNELSPPYRNARPEDAKALTELANIAGEGLPHYLWTLFGKSGDDPWDTGRERARRESGSFSYRNAIVRQEEDVVSALIGYPLADTPEPVDYEDMLDVLVPLQELEDLVAGTWYVNVLGTYPGYRSKGYGSELLSIAEQLSVDAGKSGMSIIVSDANAAARRLYERCGYRELASRRMVKAAWENAGENWVLLEKRF